MSKADDVAVGDGSVASSTIASEVLPAPTGPHRVGRACDDWVDAARPEIYSTDPQDRRELVVWVWYPATPQRGAERAAYLPEAWAPVAQFLGVDVVGVRAHAVADAAGHRGFRYSCCRRAGSRHCC